ncbi:MAG TPA: sigma-70 family RNA polymerase sigma factor [Xanthobacteraceae bacterium]|jgi:RNA polymerase sigma-70 factor (ECF subfamily)
MARMTQLPQLADDRVLKSAETALALNLISRMDFLRLKAIARLHARGLPPDVTWDDLLQEAFTRVIVGSRRKPEGVPMVAFLAGIMRSLRADHWRRARRGPGSRETLRIDHPGHTGAAVLRDPAADLEHALIAREQLDAIEQLFAGDGVALGILAGLAEGRSAAQIRAALAITKTTYDSARKRMRRALLREGLTCAQN